MIDLDADLDWKNFDWGDAMTTELDAFAYDIPCPECRAPARRPCRDPQGTVLDWAHLTRVDRAITDQHHHTCQPEED